MSTHAAELLQAKDLLFEWTLRILRARYQQSVLGWLWAFITPAAQAALFTVVFTRFVPVDTDGVPFIGFVYVALLPWNFLSSSLTDMSSAIVDNMGLVNKVYFPREILPAASMLARLFDLALGCACFVVIAILAKVHIYAAGIAYLPAILSIQIMLLMGLGVLSAALSVFVRDVRSLLVLGLQLWLYASPVFYPLQAVPSPFRRYYALNPMVGIIESYRDVILRGRPPGDYLVPAAATSVILFVLGCWLFRHLEYDFADVA
jgi:lipopolysaccharide transport system permease protein